MNRCLPVLTLIVMLGAAAPVAQQPEQVSAESSAARDASRGADRPLVDLPDGPQILTDSGGQPFRVVPIKGLTHPWALAFLPNGDMLVTELGGRLRIIRNGVLDPQPIAGVPEANARLWRSGLMDVAVHPRYAENKFIYLTYSKPAPANEPADKRPAAVITLARARFDGGMALTDVNDIFVSDVRCPSACGSRVAFARDGTVIMSIGRPGGTDSQNPANHAGKILRLRDDGTVPNDNPFVGVGGHRPEIYALGIRNAIGLFVHPQTGEIWETEHGPMGGDEINIIRPGRNYGWPVISYGSDYTGRATGGSGPRTGDRKREGMEEPFFYWSPSPAVGGITIYTGDRFPTWKGNIFVGAMGAGSHLGARQLHRIVLSRDGLPQRGGTWTMLYELKRRIRDVKQGPDGLLYLTVDATEGAVLRIEPVETVTPGVAAPVAQQSGPSPEERAALRGADRPLVGLPDGPQVLTDSGGQPFRIVPITGLSHPWALAFLPNGDMLVTELGGRLRIIRKGVLDPQPIAGLPEINTRVWRAGLMDVTLHPRYADNKFIYFVYSKTAPPNPDDSAGKQPAVTITLARARYDGGNALTDVKDLFVSNTRCVGACGSRIVFARDGTIIMGVGKPSGDEPQNPAVHGGKILRLNDDGTVPKDNPFVGVAGYRPEIYALGIRNAIGLFVHPQTGEIWETEHGPMGGDEINIIRSGRNYGWPVISYGSEYTGRPLGGRGDRKREGMEEPFYYWSPSPAIAGIAIYTGDKFPTWKGNIFVGALGAGQHLGARQLHRIVLSRDGLPQRGGDWTMLYELKRRIRDVKQGPDGFLYVTVDAMDGAVLRIEPVDTPN